MRHIFCGYLFKWQMFRLVDSNLFKSPITIKTPFYFMLFILCSILCCVAYPHTYDNFSRNKCVLIDFNRFLICYGFSFFDASIFSECAFSFHILYFLWLKYTKYYPVESLDLFHCYFFYCFKPWKVLPGSWLIVPKLWCNLGSFFFWLFCGFKKIYLTF